MSSKLGLTHWLIIFLTILKPPSISSATKVVSILIEEVLCPLYDAKLCPEFSCNLLRQADGERLINMNFSIAMEMSESIVGQVEMRLFRENVELPYLKFEMSICDILGTNFDHFLLKLIKTQVQRVSNFPLKCPFKKNYRYYIRNLNIGIHALPSYMPEVRFATMLNLSYEGKQVTAFNTVGKLVKRTIIKKGRRGRH